MPQHERTFRDVGQLALVRTTATITIALHAEECAVRVAGTALYTGQIQARYRDRMVQVATGVDATANRPSIRIWVPWGMPIQLIDVAGTVTITGTDSPLKGSLYGSVQTTAVTQRCLVTVRDQGRLQIEDITADLAQIVIESATGQVTIGGGSITRLESRVSVRESLQCDAAVDHEVPFRPPRGARPTVRRSLVVPPVAHANQALLREKRTALTDQLVRLYTDYPGTWPDLCKKQAMIRAMQTLSRQASVDVRQNQSHRTWEANRDKNGQTTRRKPRRRRYA